MSYEIVQADVMDWASAFNGAAFHALLADAPYHLLSRTRGNSQRNPGTGPFGRHALDNKPSPGFMGLTWDGSEEVAFQKETWELLGKHLLPGAYLLAFGGTRTVHRLACAIEDAGFEIKDQIAWMYGSVFPKSLNIGKAIDKASGGTGMSYQDRRLFATELRNLRQAVNISREELSSWFPQYAEVTKNWERFDAGFRVPSEDSFNVLIDKLGLS